MRSIGIDVGTSSIKVVDLEISSRSIQVRDVFESAINPDPAADRKIEILEILSGLSNHLESVKAKVTFAIDQQHVTLRHKTFPFKERTKILRSLPFDLEDDIPFDQSNAIFEAKVLRYRKGVTEVLALATPKEFVAEKIQLGFDAGIDPDIVSCEAAALSTLFEDWSNPPAQQPDGLMPEEGTATEASFHQEPGKMLLHIGHNRSVLCAFHQGIVLTARTLFWGANQAIKSLQKQYGIPYVEAYKGFIEKGFILVSPQGATAEQLAFSQAITTSLEELIQEVKRHTLEIQTDFRVKLSHIDVSGGMSSLNNLTSYLTQRFELPSNQLKPFSAMGRSDIGDALGSRCTIALGLALEGVRRPINPAVNFRQGEFSKQNLSMKLFWDRWTYTLKLGGIAVAATYLFTCIRDPMATELQIASANLIRAKAQEVGLKKGAGPSQLKTYVREQEKEIKRRRSLSQLQDINSAFSIMNQLSRLAPVKNNVSLDVSRFFVINELLTIEGSVASREELKQIYQSLLSLSSDRKLTELSSSTQSKPGRVAFSYQLRIPRRGAL